MAPLESVTCREGQRALSYSKGPQKREGRGRHYAEGEGMGTRRGGLSLYCRVISKEAASPTGCKERGKLPYPGLDVFDPPLQRRQLLIERGQTGAAGHICTGGGRRERERGERRKGPHPHLNGSGATAQTKEEVRAAAAMPTAGRTEGIEEVRDLLDGAGDHFDVLAVGPVLVDLALNRVLLHRHDRQLGVPNTTMYHRAGAPSCQS